MRLNVMTALVCASVLATMRAMSADVRLECVQGDGTAFVNTGYRLTAADVVEIEFMVQYAELAHVFGSRTDANVGNFSLSVGRSGDAYNVIADYSQQSASDGRLQVPAVNLINRRAKARIGVSERLIARYDQQERWTNTGVVKGGSDLKAPSDCYLFHLNGATFAGANPFRGRIYSFRVLRGEEEVLELLPYQRDGVCGFLNKKAKTFLPPSSGSLSGPELGCQAQYIKGDGVAYLDTGIALSSSDTVEVEFMPVSEGVMHIFGSRKAADAENFSSSIAQSGGQWVLMNDYNSNWYCRQTVPLGELLSRRVRLTMSSAMRRVSLMGEAQDWSDDTLRDAGFSTPGNCYVGYISGSPFATATMFDGRLYSFSVLRAGVKRLDLVPWKRGEEVGMRDLVSGEFIGNAASSGSFAAKEYPRPGLLVFC